MHLQFILRGLPEQVNLWRCLAQGQFFKWRRINKETMKEEIILVQGGLRESVLGTWEYIFPETALPSVLSIMGLGEAGLGVSEKRYRAGFKLGILRKLIGLKKIPKKMFEEAKKIPPSIVFDGSERGLSDLNGAKVSVHIIGIKKDVYGDMYDPINKTTHIQEML